MSVLQQPFANRWLNVAVAWELLLLILIVYVPFLHEPFGTFSLSAGDWALTAGLALTVVPLLEAVKWTRRRGWLAPPPRKKNHITDELGPDDLRARAAHP